MATVIGQIVLCSMAGYAFARMRFAASAIIFAVMLSILMIPNQAYIIPQYQIVQSLGWLDTVQGIVIPTVFSAFGTFLMRQFFVNLPKELEEAARLDGANSFQIFWKVMLPLARPSIGALAIVTILAAWNNLLWPLVVTSRAENRPLSVGIASLNGQYVIDYPVMMAASLMAMAPILILFIVMQRRVIRGWRIRGSRAERIRLQPRRRATAHALRELARGLQGTPGNGRSSTSCRPPRRQGAQALPASAAQRWQGARGRPAARRKPSFVPRRSPHGVMAPRTRSFSDRLTWWEYSYCPSLSCTCRISSMTGVSAETPRNSAWSPATVARYSKSTRRWRTPPSCRSISMLSIPRRSGAKVTWSSRIQFSSTAIGSALALRWRRITMTRVPTEKPLVTENVSSTR